MKRRLVALTAGFALLLSAGFLSCQKELSNENGGTVVNQVGSPIPVATPVTGSVAGMVVDENNLPVAAAEVTVGNTIYFTDSKGLFNTKQLTLDKYISTVKVTKPGYFVGFRAFCANPTKNYVSIKLIPKTLAGTVNSSAAGFVSLPNGSMIEFQAGFVDKASGNPYSGPVNVYAAYIDPTSSDMASRLPGSLMAQDASKFYVLASAGMIAVELESQFGVPLQLAAGKAANVKLAIPASMQAAAPATIATWSLDARGIWIKEKEATKKAGFYEFSASHFSYWNCDIPNSSIYLNIHLTDQNNQSLPNRYIDIKPTVNNLWGHCGGNTDSLGNAVAFIPANEVLTLNVFGNSMSCYGVIVHTQNIGPYSANSNLTVAASPGSQNTLSITGSATDCAGNPVQNGTAVIRAGTYFFNYATIVNGSFSTSFSHCFTISTVEAYAIDNIGQQQSPTTTVNVTGNTANVGALNACGISSNQFFNYTLDGTNYAISSVDTASHFFGSAANAGTTFSHVGGYQSLTSKYILLYTQGAAAGSFPLSLNQRVNNYYNAFPQQGSVINFTTFGASGQFLEGDFNMTFSDSTNTHACNGTFRVRRN